MNSITYFLDSNILVDWILISESKKNKENILKDDVLRKRFKEMSYGYTLVEIFFNVQKQVNVLTCNFSLAESYNIIYNEIVFSRLYKKAIPFTMWKKLKKNERLSQNDIDDFSSSVLNYFKKLKNRVEIVNDVIENRFFPLLYHKSNIGIYDSMLITTAIENNANYFVTRDKDIIKLKNKKSLKKLPIELIHPLMLQKEFEKA
jgi:predicted nucleic acid-binding protein